MMMVNNKNELEGSIPELGNLDPSLPPTKKAWYDDICDETHLSDPMAPASGVNCMGGKSGKKKTSNKNPPMSPDAGHPHKSGKPPSNTSQPVSSAEPNRMGGKVKAKKLSANATKEASAKDTKEAKEEASTKEASTQTDVRQSMVPDRVTVYTGPDGDSFELWFPLELTNPDYVRRLLGMTTIALKPTYERMVTLGVPPSKCVKPKGKGKSEVVEIELGKMDLYYLMKHLEMHVGKYADELQQDEGVLLYYAGLLKRVRNETAHANADTKVKTSTVIDVFEAVQVLVTAAQVPWLSGNLMRLKLQFKEHGKMRWERGQYANEPIGQPLR
jgi:hypothetical protein